MKSDSTAANVSFLARQLAVESDEFARVFAVTHKLSATDMRALVLIMDAERRQQTISPSQLSELLGMTNASVTALVDRLEKANHLERHRHPSDRRSIVIKLSEHARQVGSEYFMQLHLALVERLGEFSERELAITKDVMSAMISVIIAQQAAGKGNRPGKK